jgi:diaminopimelate epimerase
MLIRFTKMHGAGNDFVVIDGIRQALALEPGQVRALADRHRGVGADQVLVVEASDEPGIDFRYRIFNADGGEVEQCGNGARCFVRFVRERGLTDKRRIRVRTLGGIIEPELAEDDRVTVDMGAPEFNPALIPFISEGLVPSRIGDAQTWPIELAGVTRHLTVVSMGNPHAVRIVDDLDTAPVASEGPLTENSERFPRRVNAGFMQIHDRHRIGLRVWERGAGETLACGSGACAAAVAGIRAQLLDSPVDVDTRGGRLTIAWEGGTVLMTGPATTVFEGVIEI